MGELRGLLNTSVNMMALTATATKQTRKDICKSLAMVNPTMILKSPEKSNIVYKVFHKECSMEETFASLTEELRKNRKNTDKTIIFCRTYEDTSHIYLYFKSMLGNEMTDPIGSGAARLVMFRLHYKIVSASTTFALASKLVMEQMAES